MENKMLQTRSLKPLEMKWINHCKNFRWRNWKESYKEIYGNTNSLRKSINGSWLEDGNKNNKERINEGNPGEGGHREENWI